MVLKAPSDNATGGWQCFTVYIKIQDRDTVHTNLTISRVMHGSAEAVEIMKQPGQSKRGRNLPIPGVWTTAPLLPLSESRIVAETYSVRRQ